MSHQLKLWITVLAGILIAKSGTISAPQAGCAGNSNLVSPSDPNVFRSPFNHFTTPAFDLMLTSGAYYKFAFQNASCVLLTVDVTQQGSIGAADYPSLAWKVDNGPWATAHVTPAAKTVVLVNGLSPARHDFTLVQHITSNNVDRWYGPASALKVLNFTLTSVDAPPATVSPALRPNRIAVFGDSQTEAIAFPTVDARLSFAWHLAAALNAELGHIGYAGQGYTVGRAATGVPDLEHSWNKYYYERPRQLSPSPQFVYVQEGGNDLINGASPAAVQSACQDTLSGILREVPPTTIVLVGITFGGAYRSSISACEAIAGDARTFLIDANVDPYFSILTGTPTEAAPDGRHPTAGYHGEIATRLMEALLLAIQ